MSMLVAPPSINPRPMLGAVHSHEARALAPQPARGYECSMQMVEVATFHNPLEAELARGALRAQGIAAELFDAAVSGTYGGALGLAPARLMVEEREEAAARAFLESTGG